MTLTANVGTTDRILRILPGLVLIGLTLGGQIGAWGWIGLVPLAIASVGFCPSHALQGLSSRKAPQAHYNRGERDMRMSHLFATLALLVFAVPAAAQDIRSSVDAAALPASKATPLGLYLTPADAHAALQDNPDILFIDVRDPIEVAFVGHAAPMDANVPLRIATHAFDPAEGTYRMVPNDAFVAEVAALLDREGLDRDAPVFVMCRSGGRSAAAATQLIEAGFGNVWNLVEGFEGDKHPATGARSVNGWRNAGLPWGYRIDPAAAWQPAE